jgi:phospholipase/lecithinase/hemolysin
VPPVDRSPLALANSVSDQAVEKADIKAWNDALIDMANTLKKDKPDVNVFTVDSNKYFTQVLDNPKSYPQTAGYVNTTAYCTAYEK